jgi:hypothetical protein
MKFQSDGGIIYKYNHISCWRNLKNKIKIMARECKCKKNYNNSFSPGKLNPLYEKDKIYFFYNKGDSFYISNEKKWLKDISRWDIYIDGMKKEEFEEYFDYERSYNTPGEKASDMVNGYISRYNELFEKYCENDLLGDGAMTDVELRQFKQAQRRISLGGVFYDND